MNAALPIRSTKFTPPAGGALLPRPALRDLLEAVRGCSLVWVAGPPGSGKTTLLANAFTGESGPVIWYRLDGDDASVPTFVDTLASVVAHALDDDRPRSAGAVPGASLRQAVRTALCDLPPGAVIVLDDFDASMLTAMDAVLPLIADEVPAGATVFVATHLAPPPSLARHCANRRVAIVPPETLRLTVDETKALLQIVPTGAACHAMSVHDAAQGWLAGTLLLASGAPGGDPVLLAPGITDYFARHVFANLDLETRQALLHVVALPDFDMADAAAMSQLPHAGQLLARLAAEHLFVEQRWDSRFEIHPMFRAYLVWLRDQTLPPARVRTLLYQAGCIVEKRGHVELAADHYAAVSSWHALQRVLRRAVPPLIEARQHDRVARWLDGIPESVAREDPWVVLWRGILNVGRNRAVGLRNFELAWQAFSHQGDVTGLATTLDAAFAAFADASTNLGDATPWRERLDALSDGTADPLPPRAEAHLVVCGQVLMDAGLDHPLLSRWARRVTALVRAIDDPGLAARLVAFGASYHFWRGAVVRATALLESHDLPCADDDRRLGSLLIRGMLGAGRDPDDALCASGDAGCCVPRSGLVGLLDFVQPGEPGTGVSLRGRVRALVARRRLPEAIDLQEQHADRLREAGRRLPLALALLDAGALCAMAGQPARALRHLDEARALAEAMDSDLLRWNAGLWSAWCADQIGSATAPEIAAAAVHVGARHGYMGCHPWWDARMMTRVLRHALEHSGEKVYIARLIRERGLIPDSPEPEGWPWPVRVHTLGRFSVTVDGSTLRPQGRAQRRPMDLLKVVIAYGGRDIGLSAIIEALWPDAEGDAGRKSFDVALLRLRRILGRDDAILLGEGKVSLNDKVCWVDVWSLERLLGGIPDDAGPEAALRNARRLLARYRGPFLNLEETQSWMLCLRERLASRAVRAVLEVGRKLEHHGLWDEAATLYHGMVDVAPMHEDLVRRLMHCLGQLGKPAEARAVFERFRRLLASLLGQQPSSDMLSTYIGLTSA